MHKAMERNGGHDMDKETNSLVFFLMLKGSMYQPNNFVHRVKNKRIPPHGNGDGIIPISQAVCTDEEALGLREHPDAQDTQSVDKIAEVRKEVMVALLVIGIVAERHEVQELGGVPSGEPIRTAADEISRDEDIHSSGDEGQLLTCRDCGALVPALGQPIHGGAHAFAILVELLVGGGYSAAPFLHNAVSCVHARRLEARLLAFQLLCLSLNRLLDLVHALGKCQILNKVEDGETLNGRKEGALLDVRVVLERAGGKGRRAREARRGRRVVGVGGAICAQERSAGMGGVAGKRVGGELRNATDLWLRHRLGVDGVGRLVGHGGSFLKHNAEAGGSAAVDWPFQIAGRRADGHGVSE
jgi:hypothetical protein